MAYLIKNANLYNPEKLGTQDILVVANKIIAIGDNLEASFRGLEIINAKGLMVTPGLIDQHIHVTGGGGEGGPSSRCPELVLSELIENGITSLVGVSGTDSETRSIENLLAKVRALSTEGVSTWLWTSNYAYPVTTICGSVRKDLLAMPDCIGVKIALADHRCSFPTFNELMRLLSDIRVGGMISGKTGFLHIHFGEIRGGFSLLNECVDKGMPIKHLRPTHCAREKTVFSEAIAFAKRGGIIDLTSSGPCEEGSCAKAIVYALAQGVKSTNITISSDGHGSFPKFNETGEMIGLGVGGVEGNIETLRELINEGMPIEDALKFTTSNLADNLGLTGKGWLKEGLDADILFFDEKMKLINVMARGQMMMREGEVLVKGTFES